MNTRSFLFFMLLIIFSANCYAGFSVVEKEIKGKVVDRSGSSLVGANIFIEKHIEFNSVSDADGEFILLVPDSLLDQSVLIVSIVGYETKRYNLREIQLDSSFVIVMKEDLQLLNEVVIMPTISEEFSVIRMSRIDIYTDPNSAADPLKAITSLPSSTNTSESASPELRGSGASRSRVLVNRVPIYNPTRNTQLNGIGLFSLFNPEIIDRQLVYASNPPLIYGNTTAGLVEIETINKVQNNQSQISASLGSVGFLLSRRLKDNDERFLQVYSNYQFSDAFLSINKNSFDFIKSYSTADLGVHLNYNLNSHSKLKLYNYNIYEKFNGIDEALTYKGESKSDNARSFTILNYVYEKNGKFLSIDNGIDISRPRFVFGNIDTDHFTLRTYNSLNFKQHLTSNIFLQSGITYDQTSYTLNDETPRHYYALDPGSPTFSRSSTLINKSIELYSYGNWVATKNLLVGVGVRKNVPFKDQRSYLSYQGNIKLNINRNSNILIAAGHYNGYNIPTYLNGNFNLLATQQYAVDYEFKNKGTALTFAAYFKRDKGNLIYNVVEKGNQKDIYGIELSIEKTFLKHFKIFLANTFLHSEVTHNKKSFKHYNSLGYFFKSSLGYANPKYLNVNISFIARPGLYYTGIESASHVPDLNLYAPKLSYNTNNEQYEDYNTLNVTLNKSIRIGESLIVPYCSITNVINKLNQQEILYNEDYTSYTYQYYSKRMIYFGLVAYFL